MGLVTQFERHQTERPQLGALGREVAVGIPPLAICWFFLRRRLKAKNLMYIKQIDHTGKGVQRVAWGNRALEGREASLRPLACPALALL